MYIRSLFFLLALGRSREEKKERKEKGKIRGSKKCISPCPCNHLHVCHLLLKQTRADCISLHPGIAHFHHDLICGPTDKKRVSTHMRFYYRLLWYTLIRDIFYTERPYAAIGWMTDALIRSSISARHSGLYRKKELVEKLGEPKKKRAMHVTTCQVHPHSAHPSQYVDKAKGPHFWAPRSKSYTVARPNRSCCHYCC